MALIASGDLKHPWLAGFVRRLLHPLPRNEGEEGFAHAILPMLEASLKRAGASLADYDQAPDTADDPSCRRYCPRCHGLFLAEVDSCKDCGGLSLRDLPERS